MERKLELFWKNYVLPVKQPLDEWSIWRSSEQLCLGINDVKLELKNWNITSRIFVGVPGANEYSLPPCVPQFQAYLVGKTARVLMIGGLLWMCLGLISMLLFYVSHDKYFLAFAGVPWIIATILLVERYFGLNDARGLSERAMFYLWLQTARPPRLAVLVFGSLGIVAGIGQFLLQRDLGGFDLLITKYGFYYPSVRDGEWWRIISVPMFHGSLVHFLVNFSLLVSIVPIIWGMVGPVVTVGVFIVASFVGGFGQMFLGLDKSADATLGASGGIFGLLGFIIAMNFLRDSMLPKGFGISLSGIAFLSIVGAEVLPGNVATASHIVGLVSGGALAFFWKNRLDVSEI